MHSDDLAFLSVRDLLAAFDRREVSSREATRLMLDRIDRHDAAIHGYITVMAESALQEAQRADERRARGETGLLLGVPIAVKDLCETAGVRTTAGSRILTGYVPDQDATVVTRLRQAGAVIIGKTHMAEFAYGFPHPDYGPSRTPWDPGRSASGSSGGSGAVVAAGLAYGAIGSDTGGSIRSPAAVCGVTGHKPTYGLVSRAGVVPLSWTMDHVGPLTRSAYDAILMLQAIAGFDARDPASAPVPPWESFEESPASLKGMRVGILHELATGLDPDIEAGFQSAVETLEGLGASVGEVAIPNLDLVNAMAFGIIEPEAASYHAAWLQSRPDDYAPQTRAGLEAALTMPATQYVDAQRLRLRFNQGVTRLYEEYDILVSPTEAGLAVPIAEEAQEASHEQWDLRHTVIANLSGMPAVAIPCGFSEDGLPVSFQVMAPPHEDVLALHVGELYQSVTDWNRRRPPQFLGQ